MSDDTNRTGSNEPKPGEQQSDPSTEANKPDDARAKGEPKAGNILGGVQSK